MSLFQALYRWACERLYYELAWSYDLVSWLVSGGQWSHWRRLALGYVRGPSVLEIGFGTGALLHELAMEGYTVCGLELSPAMQAMARRRLQRVKVNVKRIQGLAQAMPFHDNSFATIVSTFPAPYILQAKTLAECRRVLQPGGALVIVGLWVDAPEAWMGRLLPVFYGRPDTAIIERMQAALAAAGLHAQVQERRVENAHVGVIIGWKTAIENR
jgi:ubiquinone/menaquinone biosynthesis C-methylase UbiE